jgi:hypothetical protein
MCEAIEDYEEVEKLGQGFSSANTLEEIDIGDGITPRPTFVNKNMSLEHKDAIIKLLKDTRTQPRIGRTSALNQIWFLAL